MARIPNYMRTKSGSNFTIFFFLRFPSYRISIYLFFFGDLSLCSEFGAEQKKRKKTTKNKKEKKNLLDIFFLHFLRRTMFSIEVNQVPCNIN